MKEKKHLKISEEQFIKLFNGLEHWRINKDLVKLLGINPSLFLTDLMSKWFYFKREGMLSDDGFFYNTHKDIAEDTTLSPYQQREALNTLGKYGIVEYKCKGVPPKNFYKINLEALSNLLENKESQMSKNLTNECQNFSHSKVKKLRHSNNNKEQDEKNKSFNQRLKDENSLTPVKESSSDDKNKELRERIKDRVNGSKKKREEFEPSQAVVASWKSACGGKLVQHEERSKRYDTICRIVEQLMKGSFFTNNKEFSEFKDYKFKRRDFVLAFDRLGTAAFDPDYEAEAGTGYKQYLQRISLITFLYNPQGADKKHKSLFMHYFQNEPTKLSERQSIKIEETPTVKTLMKGFKTVAKMNGQSYTARQMRDFSFTEKKLKEYLGTNKQNIVNFDYWKSLYGCEDDSSLMAVFLIESLKEQKEDVNLSTGWLCSDLSFSQRLPDYLKNRGLFRTLQFGNISS